MEGAEPEVLRGMEHFLKTHSLTLVMEYLTGAGQNEAHREALAFAQSVGYQVFSIKKDGSLEACKDVEAAMREVGLESDNLVLQKR